MPRTKKPRILAIWGDDIGGFSIGIYNLFPSLTGEAEWRRRELLYWTDGGSVVALRYNKWKITFLKQNAEGINVWRAPFEVLRAPMLCILRRDPFERAEHESIGYERWWVDNMFVFAPAAAYVGEWLQCFRELRSRQKPGSLNLEYFPFGCFA